MEQGMSITVLILFSLFYVGPFFLAAVLSISLIPIWAIIDMVKDTRWNTKLKVVWGVLYLIGCYIFTALIYGSFFSRPRTLRNLSRVCSVILIIYFACLPLIYPHIDRVATQFRTKILDQNIDRVAKIELEGIDQSIRKDLADSLKKLDIKGAGSVFKPSDKMVISSQLINLLKAYMKDGQLTTEEYTDWTERYKNRDSLEKEGIFELQDHVDKVQANNKRVR